MDFEIRAIEIDDAESFRRVLDSVAQEKDYLLTLEAPPIEGIREFISNNKEKGYPQVVAERGNELLGWADFVPIEKVGINHVAHLGMGVVKKYRGNGIGRALLEEVTQKAVNYGFLRLELEVFSNNKPAISLYESMGFSLEGKKIKTRCVDGKYFDSLVMAKVIT